MAGCIFLVFGLLLEAVETQKYKILNDPAGWLEVQKDTGLIKVKSEMDREFPLVQDNKYTALIGAYDDDQVSVTGTGTLVIHLQDVNDNAPVIKERTFKICNKNPVPQLFSVTDKDGPGFTSPYNISVGDTAKFNWTAKMNDTTTGIILNLKTDLERGLYRVTLSVSDNQGLSQVNTVTAQVCDCTGEDVNCQEKHVNNFPAILRLFIIVLLLLMLGLMVLLARQRRQAKNLPPAEHDDTRDNIKSDEEEGGEEDRL